MNSSLRGANVRLSDFLSQSISDALVDLLGENVRQTIYACLERRGLQRDRIPDCLPKFETFLADAFGRNSRVIERQIARRLYKQLGLEFLDNPRYSLAEYVDAASQQLDPAV